MKVAENSIIDLDILPGKGQGDVIGEAKAMADNPKYVFPFLHWSICTVAQGLGIGFVNKGRRIN